MSQTVANSFLDVIPSGTMRLAFGCGGLHGGSRRRKSFRLLETAVDCGITYFDTARMYGLGAAEGILGELASRYRHRLIIASKAGILPANRSIPMRLINRGIGLLHKAVPRSERYVAHPGATQLRFHAFSLPDLRKSVETSLKRLRTDYLDILLLHECSAADVENPQVLTFLQELKKQGKIRAFGLATGIEETIGIAANCPVMTQIVQIPSSIFDMNIFRLPPRADDLKIIHSCLQLEPLLSRLSFNGKLAKKWRAATRVDPRDTTAVVQLLLAHALHSNPTGLVLFSSTKQANIKSNVEVAIAPVVDSEQVDGLNLLFTEVIRPGFSHKRQL